MALYCVLVPYPVPGYRTARIHRVMGTQTAPGVICGERCEQPSARSTRGNTGTRVGPNGAIGRITYRLDPRVGPLATGTAPGMQTAWGSCVALGARGGTRGGLNCLTHAPATRSPDAFRRRLRRRMGTGTASSPGGVTHWAAV